MMTATATTLTRNAQRGLSQRKTVATRTGWGDLSLTKGRDGIFLMAQTPILGRHRQPTQAIRFSTEQAAALVDVLDICRTEPAGDHMIPRLVAGRSPGDDIELCDNPFSHVVSLIQRNPGAGETEHPFDLLIIVRDAIDDLIEAINCLL